MKIQLTHLIAALVVLGILSFAFPGYERATPALELPLSINLQELEHEEQTNDAANVTVKVRPLSLDGSEERWVFSVDLETHSVDLSEDMLASAALVDSEGRAYAPVAWNGSPQGGHHRSGELVFEVITPLPKSIRLIMTIAGTERIFEWNL